MIATGALLLCIPTFDTTVAQAATDDLDVVMHLLAARRHGEVSFVDQHFLSLLKRPVESTGELIYDAPNRLEKRTLEPHPETLVLSGDIVTVQRGHSSHVLELKSYPQILPLVESIRATLAGDRAALEPGVSTGIHGGRRTLDTGPRTARVRCGQDRRERSDRRYRDVLLKVEIRQTDGDRSLMTLRPHAEP